MVVANKLVLIEHHRCQSDVTPQSGGIFLEYRCIENKAGLSIRLSQRNVHHTMFIIFCYRKMPPPYPQPALSPAIPAPDRDKSASFHRREVQMMAYIYGLIRSDAAKSKLWITPHDLWLYNPVYPMHSDSP